MRTKRDVEISSVSGSLKQIATRWLQKHVLRDGHVLFLLFDKSGYTRQTQCHKRKNICLVHIVYVFSSMNSSQRNKNKDSYNSISISTLVKINIMRIFLRKYF